MNAAKLAGVGVAIAALSACGSSHRVDRQGYSVQQVKRVFAAQGIPLRQVRFGPANGVVKLFDHNLAVDVASERAAQWLTVSSSESSTRVWRNVIVTYPPSYARAVKAALRSLRA